MKKDSMEIVTMRASKALLREVDAELIHLRSEAQNTELTRSDAIRSLMRIGLAARRKERETPLALRKR